MNTVDVARESLRLPASARERYIQDQMVLLIGRPVARSEVLDALAEASRLTPVTVCWPRHPLYVAASTAPQR